MAPRPAIKLNGVVLPPQMIAAEAQHHPAETPAEAFLAGVASCGVELVQALARDEKLPLKDVKVDITGMMDRANPVRTDVTVFNGVALDFHLTGVTQADGERLIERFRGR